MNDSIAIPADTPDPEFAARLQWQIESALRREARFGRLAEPAGGARARGVRLAIAAVAFLAASAFGAGGVLAAQEIRRSRAGELLAVQYQVRFEIARLREEAARAAVAELLRANEQGLGSPQEFYAAEEKRIALAQESSLLGLDAIEVGHTGREPDRRISAALVDGRDLVTERIGQELSALQFRTSAAARRVEQLEGLREKGLAGEAELAQARLVRDRVVREQEVVARRKELRAAFRRGEIDAVRADLLALLEEARARQADAEQALAAAHESSKHARQLAAAGLASEREARAAEHEQLARDAELRLATLEVETIEARLAGR